MVLTYYIFDRNIDYIDAQFFISLSDPTRRIYVQQNHCNRVVVGSYDLMSKRILTYYETNAENTLFALAFIYNTSIRLYLLCEL